MSIIYLRKWVAGWLFMIILGLAGSTAGISQSLKTGEVDNTRYLALLLLNLPVQSDGSELQLINTAKSYGLNALYLTIPWDKVYLNAPSDKPDWTRYDSQIQLATSLGMKVAIRIHLGRNTARIKGFWETEESQISQSGVPLSGGYLDTFYGFDNQSLVDKGLGFVKEVVSRYKYLQEKQQLIFVSVTNSPTQEGEYYSLNIKDGKEQSAAFDYSESMRKGFQAWLKQHYIKIERLNFLWGTSFKSFDQAPAPATPWEPVESFRQRFGKDWYIYRHLVFKNYFEKTVRTIRTIDPSIKIISDYGSVFDQASLLRGTLGYKDLNSLTDGIKVNDDLLNHNHRWSVDILKSNFPSNFFIANELFVNDSFDGTVHQKQITENFEHGANFVAALISSMKTLTQSETFLRNSSATWLNKPLQPIIYRDSLSYRLSDAIEKKGAVNVAFSEWYQKAYADPNNPRPIKVKLEEDLLANSYWDDASNYTPYVLRPIPMQITVVNKPFSYQLPPDTFSDVDGTIVKQEPVNLPSWLKFENGILKGTPQTLADFRIKVVGTDDEGGVSEAYFTIRVDSRENSNKPPTVNSNFSNLTIAINEPFLLPIPADAFIDTDGKITKIEAFDLPSWLSYENGALTGTPRSLGEVRIFMKAYDNLNAFVETYFTLRVVEPQFLNQPPFATTPLPVKYTSVNTPFEYILPNIFGDNDGYISSITIQNRPSWLDFSLNVFSGTPTEEGRYNLIIRAYDNGGAFVDLPFTLIVEIPKLSFELVRGGRAINQSIIRKLEGDNVIPYDELPELLNIYAYGNFEYDQVSFELNGPYVKKSTTNKFPYALYEGEGGFPPFVGRYTLTVKAAHKDSAVVSNSIQFSISYGDSLDITKNIADWNFYPNPTENVINIKLPRDTNSELLKYSLISVSGKSFSIPSHAITTFDNLTNIYLGNIPIASGVYFVRVESENELLKQYKIFKR